MRTQTECLLLYRELNLAGSLAADVQDRSGHHVEADPLSGDGELRTAQCREGECEAQTSPQLGLDSWRPWTLRLGCRRCCYSVGPHQSPEFFRLPQRIEERRYWAGQVCRIARNCARILSGSNRATEGDENHRQRLAAHSASSFLGGGS
jgi:hypothetical protein